MIQRYFDFLSQEKYNQLGKVINDLKWTYSGVSVGGDTTSGKFWYSELMGHPFFTEWLSDIETVTNKKFKIDRLYANGQTLGQDGTWHFDSFSEDGYTFLYYFNDCDDYSLIGETYFMVDGEALAITPIPNSAVVFPHSYKHKGMAPKRGYNDLRVTIAFKLTEIK